MNLQYLFKLQKDLNEKIYASKNLDKSIPNSKNFLALLVELGKLANETKSFEYWSDAKPSKTGVLLDSYIDCFHLILTLGLDKLYTNISPKLKPNDYNISEQFLNLYVDINDLMVTSSKDHYTTLFEDFLSLGIRLGFSLNQIENSYIIKNTSNHKKIK
ncbi:dUTP diphosphatase [Clostridium algidicarnis]|uniref:dUTP diphosphatase n=1 Tax=Clostridium algidicarnis TaxID=37659 RepID=UPI001C0D2808|nr:dUTP diphosphatase [Clostridium algidicarnis]MBU3210288.1 dUTP diphosphatase [Clostridium algidicarnis]MBU3228641.1 dUTP diphosphatase [Clostridium algidicarnis]MBU3251313.1 dUTP diphosphatase [Clostridium algidicarnis]